MFNATLDSSWSVWLKDLDFFEFDKKNEATNVLFFCLGLSFIGNVAPMILYELIFSLQIISHMPLNNVNFPRSVLTFMQYLNKILSFEKFNPNNYLITGFSDSTHYNENFAWLQYD